MSLVPSSRLSVSDALLPAQLSKVFTEIGRQLAVQQDGDSALQTLSDVAVERVRGAQHAGISIGREGKPFSTAAATDDVVRRTDAIQYELGAGPCVDAILDDTTFNAADLRTDPRWPEFGRRAASTTGIVSMLSLRLFVETDNGLIAGLNLYSHESNAFDDHDETMAVLLATHGALGLAGATARDKARNLETALTTSREIGIAVGILMAQHKLTREQAFDLLVIASQRSHRKVAALAAEVADTGALPGLPRLAAGPASGDQL